MMLEALPNDDAEERARVAEAIGFMFAYSMMTDTRMLAKPALPHSDAYELLFSFVSPENKSKFLRLLQSNEATARESEDILIPQLPTIEAAQPLNSVLPEDVMQQVTIISMMVLGGRTESIQ